ncbi:MAG: hypothetical protein ACU83N_02735 [Gammaproteobacteria bacterium]
MKLNKTHTSWGVAAATLTMAGTLVAPQASAASKAEHALQATDSKVQALEAQVNQMSQMLQTMQDELGRVRAAASRSASENTAKVQELDQWVASIKNTPVQSAPKDHTFSARGGWMRLNDNRGSTAAPFGSGIGTDVLTSETDQDAFYYGGAIDFNMNNDLFGLMDGISFGLELGLEYSELGDREDSGLDNVITGLTVGTTNVQQSVTVNMLRVSAAPKLKFMHGSKFRPWLIPAGIDINIISPPSDAVTVLNTGMQFGAGAEYEVFNGIVVGADGRYHWTPDDVDGVDTDGFTLGGSVGFKF